MSELQELYQLQQALREKEWANNIPSFDSLYEKKLRNTAEAKEQKEAEAGLNSCKQKLRDAKERNLEKKEERAKRVAEIATLALTIIAFLFVFFTQADYITSKFPELTSSVWQTYAMVFLSFFYASAILALIAALFRIEESSALFLVIGILACVGSCIAGFNMYEGWVKILGIILPVVSLLTLPWDLLVSLFSWEWNMQNTAMWVLPTIRLIIIVTACFAIIALSKWITYHVFSNLKEKTSQEISEYEAEVRRKQKDFEAANANFEKAKSNVHVATSSQISEMKLERELLLARNNTLFVIATSRVLPESDKNLRTVTNIIWCLEQKYARDITEAKQWLVRMEHDKMVQKKLNEINNRVSQTNQRLYSVENKVSSVERKVEKTYDAAIEAGAYASAAYSEAKRANDRLDEGIDVRVDVDVDIR